MRIEICFYQCVILSETPVLEGGVWGSSPREKLVIFVRNGEFF